MRKQAVISLSGGMDSTSLLLQYLALGYDVTALSFDYGQKHRLELDRAKELTQYLIGEGELPVFYHVVVLGGLGPLLDSALVTGNVAEVPEGHYEEENMKATVVPNRNKIFASIIQAVALSIAQRTGQKVQIAMGIHAGDHDIYPDCRKEFRDADFYAFQLGNWGSEKVLFQTPYLHMNKFEILQDSQFSCEKLGLDFNEVFKRTNTSYKPIQVGVGDAPFYSDYKSAASVERIEAFIKLGSPDPVQYADETGLVPWEVARDHVKEVLAQHAYSEECP